MFLQVDSSVSVKLAVVAEVSQGSRPVLGATVTAEVERPADSSGAPYPPLQMRLADTGSGADRVANDGTYSRYFAQWTGKGRYSVRCQVRVSSTEYFTLAFPGCGNA